MSASGHNKVVIKKGDVVVVHDDKSRLHWRLAVVEDLIEGKDGLVRAAHIRMDKLKTTRPIVKLYPLEVSHMDTVSQATTTSDDTPSDSVEASQAVEESSTARRVQREAVSRAHQKIAEWTNVLRAPEDVEN